MTFFCIKIIKSSKRVSLKRQNNAFRMSKHPKFPKFRINKPNIPVILLSASKLIVPCLDKITERSSTNFVQTYIYDKSNTLVCSIDSMKLP